MTEKTLSDGTNGDSLRPKTVRGDSFYEGLIFPLMSRLSSDAHGEVDYWLEEMRRVPLVVEREAVLQNIGNFREWTRLIMQGADPRNFYKQLVDIVAEREGGPTPFVGRLIAVRTLAHLHAMGKIKLNSYDILASRLKLAISTDPYPRGSVLLRAGMDSILRQQELRSQKKGDYNWWTSEECAGDGAEEKDRWKRAEMLAYASRQLVNMTNDQLGELLLQTWRPTAGTIVLGADEIEGDPTIPKAVIRLGVYTTTDLSGRFSQINKICRITPQILGAGLGIPSKDLYRAGGFFDRRNLTVLRSYPTLEESQGRGNKPALKERRNGIGLDAMYPLSEDVLEQLEDTFPEQGGGVRDEIAQELLPAMGIGLIAAVRTSRRVRLHRPDIQLGQVGHELEAVIRGLEREVILTTMLNGQAESKKFSILGSLTEEFNRKRGKLEDRQVTQEYARRSLQAVVRGLVITYNYGVGQVRPEHKIWELFNRIVSEKGIPLEDARRFPRLLDPKKGVKVETIRTEKPPGKAKGPIRIEKALDEEGDD